MSVLAIAGLPGSGKSRRIDELKSHGHVARDDININWSEGINQVRDWFSQGMKVVVSDIEFVKPEWRERLKQGLDGIDITWEFFANDPQKCLRNVVYRFFAEGQKRPLLEEIRKILESTTVYQPPSDAIPVILADSTLEGLVKVHNSPERALEWVREMTEVLETVVQRQNGS